MQPKYEQTSAAGLGRVLKAEGPAHERMRDGGEPCTSRGASLLEVRQQCVRKKSKGGSPRDLGSVRAIGKTVGVFAFEGRWGAREGFRQIGSN